MPKEDKTNEQKRRVRQLVTRIKKVKTAIQITRDQLRFDLHELDGIIEALDEGLKDFEAGVFRQENRL